MRARTPPSVVRWPLYPGLIGASFVLNALVSYEIPTGAGVRAIVVLPIILLTVAALVGARVAGRRGAATASVPLMLLLLRGPVLVVLMVCFAAFLIMLLADRVWRISWATWTTGANVLAALLLLVSAATWLLAAEPQARSNGAARTSGTSIYLLLLDGHPRADTMRILGAEPAGFLASLDDLGFDHYPEARSNYDHTAFSLASLFNMNYVADIDVLVPVTSAGAPLQPAARQALNDAQGLDEARALGYEIVSISPGWTEVELRAADRFLDPCGMNDFELALVSGNGLQAILERAMPSFVGDVRRERIECVLDTVVELASDDHRNKRLIWAHVPAPHFPIVYASGGGDLPVGFNDVYAPLENAPDLRERYVAHLKHVDDLVLSAVQAIRAADPNAAVVLLSDHGSHYPTLDAEEHVQVLLAAVTPDRSRLFGEAPTLVNLLPMLFNAYDNAGLALHADRSSLSDGTVVSADQQH